MMHRIENIQFDLHVHSGRYNDAIERDIHLRFKKKVLEPIDALLDKLPLSPMYQYNIPVINIEESVNSLSDLDRQFENIKRGIFQSIQKQMQALPTRNKKPILLSTEERCEQFVIPYLKSGMQPAHTDARTWGEMLETLGAPEVLRFSKNIKFQWSTDAIKRLLELFSFSELSAELLGNDKKKQEIIAQMLLKKGLRNSFFKKLDFVKNDVDDVFNKMFLQIIKKEKISKQSFQHEFITFLLQENDLNVTEQIAVADLLKSDKKEIVTSKSKKELDEAHNQSEYFVENAGVFLLHPFIPQLFSILKIWGGQEIHDFNKAASLLHYLAAGSTSGSNYSLQCEKLFIGLAPEAIIDTSEQLSQIEIDECDELLLHAINLWTALKNSSPDTVRQLFLQRNAIVKRRDDKWIVNFEQKPYDILLERIPWGVGMIKLPWMNKIIELKFKE